MQRGTITILLILSVAVLAATASLFYHYANQRHAQDFWGSQTAALIDKAPKVEVMELGEADPSLAVTEEAADGKSSPAAEDKEPEKEEPAAEPPPTVKALEFNETPWLVLETRDAAAARGISNLRRALVLDTTYNWSELPPETEPVWQYALGVTDGRDWATVLFDFDSRRVALAGGRKVAVLNEEAAREFKTFFDGQFASVAADHPRETSEESASKAAAADAAASPVADQESAEPQSSP